ncbi:MAG: hypothetical protein M0R80_03780 [Proteobacteria bacterium]|nr:hypothetical protein [Pseudomonadota bacterium]
MEIAEEELEVIKKRSYNLGVISALLDNTTYYLQNLNNSLDKSREELDKFKKKWEEVDGMEGINP